MVGQHAQASSAHCMGWLRQNLGALEYNADVLAFRVLEGIFVVFDVAGLGGVDGVVAAHGAVVAGKPFRAALAEDDVARDYVLFCAGRSVSLYFLSLAVCVYLVSCRVYVVETEERKKVLCMLYNALKTWLKGNSHTSTLLSTQSLSSTVLCRVGGSLGLV